MYFLQIGDNWQHIVYPIARRKRGYPGRAMGSRLFTSAPARTFLSNIALVVLRSSMPDWLMGH